MDEKIKKEIEALKKKYGVNGDYYPSKVEVLLELERRIEEIKDGK
jgi:hypothetical protein